MRFQFAAAMAVCATAVSGLAQRKPFEINAQTLERALLTEVGQAISGPYQETCKKNLAGMLAGK